MSPAWFWLIGLGLLACGADITIEDGEGGSAEGDGGHAPTTGGDGGADAGGSDASAGGFGGAGPIDLEVACTKYCEQAAPKGCPEEPGCEASCASLGAVACRDELVEFLRCAGPLLGPECVVGYPDNIVGASCIEAEDRLASCVFDDASCSEIRSEAMLDGGCRGTSTCDGEQLMVSCDDAGHCLCFDAGVLAGSCSAIMSGIELCSPQKSCCTQYF